MNVHKNARSCPASRELLGKRVSEQGWSETNGKAERFIQTLLREWAYRFSYDTSEERKRWLTPYLHFYNYHRAHSSLAYNPPISRLRNEQGTLVMRATVRTNADAILALVKSAGQRVRVAFEEGTQAQC